MERSKTAHFGSLCVLNNVAVSNTSLLMIHLGGKALVYYARILEFFFFLFSGDRFCRKITVSPAGPC